MLPPCWVFGALHIHNLVLDVWLSGVAEQGNTMFMGKVS